MLSPTKLAPHHHAGPAPGSGAAASAAAVAAALSATRAVPPCAVATTAAAAARTVRVSPVRAAPEPIRDQQQPLPQQQKHQQQHPFAAASSPGDRAAPAVQHHSGAGRRRAAAAAAAGAAAKHAAAKPPPPDAYAPPPRVPEADDAPLTPAWAAALPVARDLGSPLAGAGGDAVAAPPVGRIRVVMGPMFAGKSTALLDAVAALEASGRRVALVKSAVDDRYAKGWVVTHGGRRARCFAARSLSEWREEMGGLLDRFHVRR